MDNQILLELIKASQNLTNRKYDFDKVDWNAVYKEAASQAVIGLVAHEVPDDVLSANACWQKAIYRQRASYARYLHAENELKTIMDTAGIPFVILKGNAAAIYYKHPERRNMGDIDFLVKPGNYDEAKELLLDNGFSTCGGEDYRNIGLKKDGIKFELHRRFSANDLNIEEEIWEGFDNRIIRMVGNYRFPMLPRVANGLVLLAHMRMHLKHGMGLRQIIDWMMYVNTELTDFVWNCEFEALAQRLGICKFAKVTTKMCQMYLGLPESITWCRDADEKLSSKLMTLVMEFGNFGVKNVDGTPIESVNMQFRREGVIRFLQKRGEVHWKAYHKHHWLRPFCWIYQAGRYAKQGLKTGRSRKQISEDAKRGKERADLLKEMGI